MPRSAGVLLSKGRRRVIWLDPLEPRTLLSAVWGPMPLPGLEAAALPVAAVTLAPAPTDLAAGERGVSVIQWQGESRRAANGQWLISVDGSAPTASSEHLASALALHDIGLHIVGDLGAPGQWLVQSDGRFDSAAVRARLTTHPLIAHAEPNLFIDSISFTHASIADAGAFSFLTSAADIGIAATKGVVTISAAGEPIVVAVIDTGVDYTHPALADALWTNPGEIAGNGLDDDGNGFADDVFGYDFANRDADPMDDNGHGTHVAGIIAGVAGAMTSMMSTGGDGPVRIMSLKFLDAEGSGFVSDAVRAINYAVMMKTRHDVNVHVLNNSWGGAATHAGLSTAAAAAANAEMLFVAAAGNASSDNDSTPHFPSNLSVANVIAVAAIDGEDDLASFSNWGATTVDIAAPGVGIVSTVPGNAFARYSGTSMAAPHVSAVAAMLRAADGEATSADLRGALLDGATATASLTGRVASGGRLNAAAALHRLAPTPDSYEQNDSAGDVQAQPAGGQHSPNLGVLKADVTIDHLNFVDDDQDWFAFETVAAGEDQSSIAIVFDAGRGDMTLTLFSADGVTELARGVAAADGEVVSLAGLAAGRYLVRVTAPAAGDSAAYALSITVPLATHADDYEDNDTPGQTAAQRAGAFGSPNLGAVTSPRTITGLNMLDDANDWYRFELHGRADALHHVEALFDHHDGDLDMALYREDGVSLISRGLSATDNERISLAGLEPGTYFVKVYGYLGAANRQYALRLVPPPPDGSIPPAPPAPQAPGPPALTVDFTSA